MSDSPRRIRVLVVAVRPSRILVACCIAADETRQPSPECHSLVNRMPQIAETSESVAATLLAAFSGIRKKPWTACPGGSLPRSANCAKPASQIDDHTREPGDVEMKGLSTTLQPQRPTGTRSSMRCPGRPDTPTLSPECQQPSHQSVSNPVNRGRVHSGEIGDRSFRTHV